MRVRAEDEASGADKFAVRMMHQSAFRGFENYVYQHKLGLLDESEWIGIRNLITDRLQNDPGFQ